jgi:hypothetical protein
VLQELLPEPGEEPGDHGLVPFPVAVDNS